MGMYLDDYKPVTYTLYFWTELCNAFKYGTLLMLHYVGPWL